MGKLSFDARVIAQSVFGFGDKSTLRIGGIGAKHILTERSEAAINELVDAGYLEARRYNDYGRMEYQGVDRLSEIPKLSFEEMDKYGQFSLTRPIGGSDVNK